MKKEAAIETATAILSEHFDGLTSEVLISKISGQNVRTYSTSEFAKIMDCSKPTVHRWLNEGMIKGKKNVLGKIRISESEISKILG
ncbi:MAG: helix-turn-helix domain-containing protein [Lentisphaeraceae bacterium]|nr:helix-turn-helix domain-containing protein [Lentisphaeraceae bacterium]